MKNFLIGCLLLSAATGLSSCKDSAKIPAPAQEDLPLLFPRFEIGDKETSFLKYSTTRMSEDELRAAGLTRPTVKFVIEQVANRDLKIATLEVYKSYGRGANSVFSYTPRVKLAEYPGSALPITATFKSDQLLAGLTFDAGSNAYSPIVKLQPDGITPDPQFSNNNFTDTSRILITFEYIMEDGRRIILTPLSRAGVVTGTFTNPPYALRISTGEEYDLVPQ